MEARTQTIKGVFQNSTLMCIPFYQRRYVWDEEVNHNWSRFAEDMESTLTATSNYFLGALILKELEATDQEIEAGISQKYQVVDGQQRLTTLSIYMKVLSLLTGSTTDFDAYFRIDNPQKDPTIKHNFDDRPAFNRIMLLDAPLAALPGFSGNIVDAYYFFLNRFREIEAKGTSLRVLRNKILSRVNFVVIELKKEDDEQQIFDTINSLGVDLTTDELLKNYLYEEKDEQAYNTSWRLMFDQADAKKFWGTDASSQKQAKSRGSKVIDRFLHAFVRIKMWDFKLNELQKKDFVKVENVYNACKSFVEDFGMNKQKLANEILAYAELFKDNLGEEVLDKRIPDTPCIERISCMVNAAQWYVLTPYVLYILNKQSNLNERNLIWGYLENYIVRRVFANTNNNNYSDLFSENLINNKVLTYNALDKYISAKGSSVSLSMPQDADIAAIIGKTKLKGETIARLLWYLYETKKADVTQSTVKLGYNKYMAVQIMPGECVNWPKMFPLEQEQERKIKINTIGNYILLEEVDEKLVKKAAGFTIANKVASYKQWSGNVDSAESFLANVSVWDCNEIDARNKALAASFSSLWQ